MVFFKASYSIVEQDMAHAVHHTVILGAQFIVAHDVLYILNYEHVIPCIIINNL